jgi:DNA-binding HxlR family transcriptional regulator
MQYPGEEWMQFEESVKFRRASLIAACQRSDPNATTLGVLVMLNLVADSTTGSGKINVPFLRHYFPTMSHRTAQRSLEELEDRGLIYRHDAPHSPYPASYWLHGYEVTRGPLADKQVDISSVVITKNVDDLIYRLVEEAAR